MFFLQAPRALGDPDLRHKNASIGHAVSTDLTTWAILPTALVPGPARAWDDLATWTGSVIAHDGLWHMLYTGISSVDGGLVQRIGLATSSDLTTWIKDPANPVIIADPRWYEGIEPTGSLENAWRDPWLFRDPDGSGFHALITARTSAGRADERGVIGHATSDDLVTWRVLPPLSKPGEFGQLEVPQVEMVNGQGVLIFSARAEDVSAKRLRRHPAVSATYVCPIGSLLGPFDPHFARAVTVRDLYSGRLVQRHDGTWVMLGFRTNDGVDGFPGEISDPIPLEQAIELEIG